MESPFGSNLSQPCSRHPSGLHETYKDHQPQCNATYHDPCFTIDKPGITFPVIAHVERKHGVSGIGNFVIPNILGPVLNQNGWAVPCPNAKVSLQQPEANRNKSEPRFLRSKWFDLWRNLMMHQQPVALRSSISIVEHVGVISRLTRSCGVDFAVAPHCIAAFLCSYIMHFSMLWFPLVVLGYFSSFLVLFNHHIPSFLC